MNFDDRITDALDAAAHRPHPDDTRLDEIMRVSDRRRTGRIAATGVAATAVMAAGLGVLLVNLDETGDRVVPADPSPISTVVDDTVASTTLPAAPEPETSAPAIEPVPASTAAPTTSVDAGRAPDPVSASDRIAFVRDDNTIDVWGDTLVAQLDPCGDDAQCEITASDLLGDGGALVAVTTGGESDATSRIVRFAPDGSLLDDEFVVAPTGEQIDVIASTSNASTVWFGQGQTTFDGDESVLYRIRNGEVTTVASGMKSRAGVVVSGDDRYVAYLAPGADFDDVVVADTESDEQLNVIPTPQTTIVRLRELSTTGSRLLADTGVEGSDLVVIDPLSDTSFEGATSLGLDIATSCFVDDSTLLGAGWGFNRNTGGSSVTPVFGIDTDDGQRTARTDAILGRRLQCRSDGSAVTTTGDGDLVAIGADGAITVLSEGYEAALEAIPWADWVAIIDTPDTVAVQNPTNAPGDGYAACFEAVSDCRATSTEITAAGDLFVAVQDGEGDDARSFIRRWSLYEDAGEEVVEAPLPAPITDIAAVRDRSRIWFAQDGTLFESRGGETTTVATTDDGKYQTIALSPDERYLAYVGRPQDAAASNEPDQVITIVDVSSGEVLNTIGVPPAADGDRIPPQFANPIEWSPDGDRLLIDIGVDDAQIALIDPFAANTFDDAIRLGDTVPTACFLGDGTVLAGRWFYDVGNEEFLDGPLVEIDPETLEENERTSALWGDELRCHPDGTALTVDQDGRLVRITPDGDTQVVAEGYQVIA